VLARQEKHLECVSAVGGSGCPGRGMRIVLGAGDSPPPNRDRQDPDEGHHSGRLSGRTGLFSVASFLFAIRKRAFFFPEVRSWRAAALFGQRLEILPRMHWRRCAPARQQIDSSGGNFFSCLTFPPPKTTSSGFKSGNQTGDPRPATSCRHFVSPQRRIPRVPTYLRSLQLVREMGQLHGFHDAVHDHGGIKPRPVPKPRKTSFHPCSSPKLASGQSLTELLTGHNKRGWLRSRRNPAPPASKFHGSVSGRLFG